jgi:small subunit ribosomal protein S20
MPGQRAPYQSAQRERACRELERGLAPHCELMYIRVFSRTRVRNMANSAQARKRARQANVRRDHNTSQRSELRTAIKNVRKAILAGDKQAAQAIFLKAQTTIDSIADKNIIHKNKAARHKSRLSGAIKSMAAAA